MFSVISCRDDKTDIFLAFITAKMAGESPRDTIDRIR